MKYRFHSAMSPSRDEWVLRLTRYHDDGTMEVLTGDGWQTFTAGTNIDYKLPSISGRDLMDMERVVNLIADMEDRIKQAIKEQEDGTSEEISGYYEWKEYLPPDLKTVRDRWRPDDFTSQEHPEGTSPPE